MTADRRGGRASWHARTDQHDSPWPTWPRRLLAVPVHAWGAAPRWLVIHLFLLGAVTNAIVTWTAHFTTALLRARGPSPRAAAARLVLLNFALVAVLGGVTADVPAIAISGAAVLATVIAVHLTTLVLGGRRALNGRFADGTRFYWVAAAALLAGIGFGTALLIGLPPGWHERIYLAHVHANLFGWIALSVLGTEVTLWPTVLRTRIVAGAEVAARRALVVTAAGLIRDRRRAGRLHVRRRRRAGPVPAHDARPPAPYPGLLDARCRHGVAADRPGGRPGPRPRGA